jgi:hypothetical protein
VDGGLLFEDGAAERGSEGQDDTAQTDLQWSADSGVPETTGDCQSSYFD